MCAAALTAAATLRGLDARGALGVLAAIRRTAVRRRLVGWAHRTIVYVCALGVSIAGLPVRAATYTWTPTAGGTYSWIDSNWGTTEYPNAVGDIANLSIDIAGDQIVQLNRGITIGALNIGDASGTSRVTISTGTAGALILDALSGNALVTKLNGANDVISAGVIFNDNLTITNNSTGSLTFSGGIRSLVSDITFDGTGPMIVNTASIATGGNFIKAGSGTTTLSIANAWSGSTTVTGGTLALSIASAIPARSAVTVNPGAVLDYLNVSSSIGSLAGGGDIQASTATTTTTLTIGALNTDTTFSGRFVAPATANRMAITKNGGGTLTLAPTAASTYTGATIINGGAFALDFSAGSLTSMLAATPVTLSGGNLLVKGRNSGGAIDQTLGNLTVGATGGSIIMDPNGSSLGTQLTFGTLTATTIGGTLLVVSPTGTTVRTSTNFNANSIYAPGRAVFSDGTNYDWLSKTGAAAPYTFIGLPQASYTAMPEQGGLTTTNYLLTSGVTASASMTLTGDSYFGTLKIHAADGVPGTLDLDQYLMNLLQNGLLFSGPDAYTISATTGRLSVGNGSGAYDLNIHQYGTNAAGLTLNAPIIDNPSGTVSLVKAGPGLLTLGGANTFTGSVVVSGGTLSFSNLTGGGAGSLGNGIATAVTLHDGSTLRYTGSASGTIAAGTTAGSHTFVLQGGLTTIDVTTSGVTMDLAGGMSGTGGLIKTGAGNLILNASTFTGIVRVDQGILRAVNLPDASPLTVAAGATYDLYGTAGSQTDSIGSLAGAGTVINSAANAKTLSVGGDHTSTTFSGNFEGPTLGNSFTKVGSGTMVISSAQNLWTGTKSINGGVVRFGSATAFNSLGGVTVANGAIPARWDLNGYNYTNNNSTSLTIYGSGSSATSQALITLGDATLTFGGNLTQNNNNNPQAALITASSIGSINLAVVSTFTINNSLSVPTDEAELTISSPISGIGGITKAGLGNLRITGGTNTSTGANAFNSGITWLDYRTDNTAKLGSGNVTFGGGTLILQGNASAATTQAVGTLALTTATKSTITLANGAGQNLLFSFGNITRAASAGTLRLQIPAGVQSATNGFFTTQANDVNGLLTAAITITDSTGTYFAMNSGGSVVPATLTSQDNLTLWGTGGNYSDVAGYTGSLDTETSIGSLRFNSAAGASTVAVVPGGVLNIGSGGILQTTNVTGGTSTISGGRLTSGTGNELLFTVESLSQRLDVTSTIGGASIVTKTGDGTLRLGGYNNYTGATNLQSGTLQAIGGNAIGDTSPIVFSTSQSTVFELLADETVGGIGHTATLNSGTAHEVRLNGFDLTVNDSAGRTFAGTFTGSGNIIRNGISGSTNWLLQGATGAGFTGTLTINGGLVYVESGAMLGNATAITLNKNSAFLISNNGTGRPASRILDTTPITLNSADGSWSGDTRPSGLSLRTDQTSAANETVGALNLNSGANYARLETANTNTVAQLIVDNLTRANNATFDIRGTNMTNTTANRSQIRIGTTANETAFIATMVGGGSTTAGTKNISIVPYMFGEEFAGAIADTNMGNSLLTYVTGNGFRALNLTTEYFTFATKTTNQDNIRLSGTANVTGIAAQTINSLVVNNTNTVTNTQTVSGSGNLVVTSGAFLFTAVGASASTDMGVLLSGFSGITVGATNEYVFFVQRPTSVATAATMTATISAALTSAADITKSGRGTLILTTANTAGGGARKTTLNEGVLQITSLGQIGGATGGLVFAGGTLQLGVGYSGDLSTRTVSLLNGGGTLDTNGIDLLLANSFATGSGNFIKSGVGSLTFAAGAGYTGSTAVQNGRLVVRGGANNRLTTGAGWVLGTGTLSGVLQLGDTVGGASDQTIANLATSGTGTTNAIVGGAGTVSTLTINQATTTTYNGSFGGAGTNENNLAVVKTGLGTMTFGAANTFTGGLTIRQGTVIGNVAGFLGDPTNVVALGDSAGSADATLNVQGTFTYANPITIASGTTGGISILGGFTTGAPTLNGLITLNNNLIVGKLGTTGDFTLAGGTTGTGNLTISNIGTTGAIRFTTGTLDHAGSIINSGYASATTTIAGNITANVTSLVQTSPTSALTLSGTTIAYTGATNVAAGTLSITGGTTGPLSTSALSVAGGATLNLLNGLGQVINLGGGALSLGLGTGAATFGLEIGSPLNYDRILTSNAATTANSIVFNFTGLTGIQAGNYDLLTASGGLNNATYSVGSVSNFGGFLPTIVSGPTFVRLTLAELSGDVYWRGAYSSSWSTFSGFNTNFTTDLAGNVNATTTPGRLTRVIYSSSAAAGPSITTTLDANFTVAHLGFLASPAGVTSVTLSPGTPATNTLTISPTVATDGIFVDDNAGAVTITAPLVLGANQTWNIIGTGANGSSLQTGAISGVGNLTKDGAGTLTFANTTTYSGTTTIAGGVLISTVGNGFSASSAFTVGAAGTLRLGASAQAIGSLAGASGGIVENGPSVSGVLTAGANNTSTTFAGTLQNGATGTLGLIKVGTGTLTLSGTNSYTGTTTINAGALAITGTTNVGSASILAGGNLAGARGRLLVSPTANLTATTISTGANATASGGIYQSGGAVTTAAADGTNLGLLLGAAASGYGYYKLSDGTLTANRITLGGSGFANATGIFEQSGGTSTFNVWTVVAHNASNALLDLSGGTLNSGGSFALSHTSNAYAVVNVRGTGVLNRTGTTISLMQGNANASNNVGILNVLAGGTVRTNSGGIVNGGGGGSGNLSQANFNGGTIFTNVASATLINIGGAAMTATSGAFLYSGGLTVDTNSLNSTIPGILSAPTGMGLASIAVTSGGSGYIGAPMIKISGGSGAGATAIANMVDDGNGLLRVGSITITNPGIGYQANDALTFTFGDNSSVYTTQATLGATTFATNVSGGLIKTNGGTLTLGGNNTFTGPLRIDGGTIAAATFNSVGTAGPLGSGIATNDATHAASLVLNGGILSYTGAVATTDRLFTLTAAGGEIQSNNATAANSISFTATLPMTYSGAGARTFTLGGANTGVNAFNLQITNAVTDAVTLMKSGVGTWSVTNATNSYTGGTDIAAGVLQFNQGSLGTAGAITFTGTSTLRWNGHTQDLSSRLSFALGAVGSIDTNGNNIVFASGSGGAGTMAKTGAGSLTLNAAALQTGGFTLNSGTLNLGHAGALGSGTFTISGVSTIDNTSGGPLTISTNPAQAWNADFTFTGSNALNLGTGDVTLGAARTITVAADTLTVGGAMGGLFGLSKAGPGTLYLTGNSTFGAAAGSTITISGGGILKIDSEANLGNVLNDVTFGTGNGTLHVTNGFNANAGKVFTIGANQATIQVDSGTMTINSALVGTANTTGGLIKTGNGTLTLAAASTGYDVQGVGLNGATGVGFRVDAGTLMLQGGNGVVGDANPNTMTIQLNGGNLAIQSDTASIARANLYVSAPATLTADVLTPGLGGAQALGAGSGAALTMGLGSSTLAIIGGENVTSGTQVVQFGATTFLVDPTFNIVNPSSGAITQLNLGAITGGTFTPTLTGNGRFTQTGVLTSTGGFTLAAGFSGLATLNQANAYTGVTTVNGGVLAFSTSGNLGNASATNRIQLGGGTLRYTATGALDITTTRQITLTPGTTSSIDVASDIGTLRATGGIVTSVAANLTKVGAGTLVISNPVNLNGGALNVADGTLTAGFTSTSLGRLAVGSTGILQLIDGAATTLTLGGTAGALALAGGARLGFELDSTGLGDSIIVGAGGTAATSGGVITFDFTRLTNFGAGTYTLLQSTGGGLLQGGTTYTVGNAPSGFNYVLNATDNEVTLQTSVLSNRYWTNSQGGNSWNTLTGGTLANFSTDLAGTTNAGARPGAADTVIFSATTITATSIATTLDAPFTIDSLQFNRQPSAVTAVAINPGAGGAANILTLTPVSPSNGINVAAQAGAVTISAPVIVAGPQTWFVDGTSPSSLIMSGAVTFGAAVTKTGAGSLTLSGANSGNGPITLAAGTIVINSAGALGTGRFTIGAGTTINSTVATTLVTDNPLTFNGGFTFTGGQTLTFGNGPVTLADNITITATASTLTFGGVIDDGVDSFQLTKSGSGTLVLNGASTYGGGTVLNGGILQIGHKSALGTGVLNVIASSTLRPGTELTTAVGGPVANDIVMSNTLIFAGTNSITMSGALTVTGAARTLTNNLTAPALLTLSGNVFLSEAGATAGRNLVVGGTGNTRIDGVVSNGPTAGGWLIKTGTGTLTLGASNTHTSFFIIDQGIVALAAGADQNIPSTFFYGQNSGIATAGTFDLSSASATYSSMIVQLNTASVATALIGAGQSLNINGSVTIGTGAAALTTTSFAATGVGTFNAVSTGASTAFIVGGSTSTASMGNIAVADFSGLATMNVNYSGATSVITINPNNTSTTTPTSNSISGLKSTLKLAPVSSLRAATLNVGAGPTNAGAVDQYNSLILGGTSNVINVNTFNVGTGLRDLGYVMFGGATGTVTIRALDTIGRAAMNIGTGTSQTDVSSTAGNVVDFTGHTADLLLSTLTIGNQARQTSITNTFSFSMGTLDATAVVVGANSQAANTTPVDSTFTNTMNIGGGTVTIGAGGLDIGFASVAATGNDQLRSTVNISAGNVTVANNPTWGGAVRLGVINVDTPAWVFADLNITGGTLTLGGDLLFGTLATSRTVFQKVVLDGGTLDLGGHNFGGSNFTGATVEFRSGTLSNVNQYGDGGFLATVRKIGDGLLLFNTQNNFTGRVLIDDGTLRISHGQALGDFSTYGTTVNAGTLEILGDITTAAEPLVINIASRVQLRNVSGDNVYSGPIELSGVGAARIESLAGTLTFDVATGNAFSGSSVVFEGAGNFIVNDPLALGASSVMKQGAGTLALNAASTYTGITTISGGVLSAAVLSNGGVDSSIGKSTSAAANLVFDGGTLRYTGATSTSTDRNFTIVTGKTAVFDVVSSNATLILTGTSGTTDGGLTKTGAGALTLAAAFYGYSGTTTVAQGTLNSADGTELTGDVAVQSGASLSAGSNAAGIHNDGVGTLSIGGNLALAAGSTLVLDFNNGFGDSPGADWDLIRFTDFGSSFDLSGQENGINLKLMSWRSDNSGYGTNNLDIREETLSWLFVDTGTNGSISGLTYDGSGHVTNFNIDTSQVSAQSQFGGSFYVTQVDNNLYLNYSSVPEPGSLLLTSLAALGFAGYRRRRRKKPAVDVAEAE